MEYVTYILYSVISLAILSSPMVSKLKEKSIRVVTKKFYHYWDAHEHDFHLLLEGKTYFANLHDEQIQLICD